MVELLELEAISETGVVIRMVFVGLDKITDLSICCSSISVVLDRANVVCYEILHVHSQKNRKINHGAGRPTYYRQNLGGLTKVTRGVSNLDLARNLSLSESLLKNIVGNKLEVFGRKRVKRRVFCPSNFLDVCRDDD